MIQYDNTFLVSDVSEIPANKLKLLSQIITFIPKIENNIGIEYSNNEISILTNILFDHIYIFQGTTNDVNIYYKDEYTADEEIIEKMYEEEDKEGLTKHMVGGADFDSSNFQDIYFKIKNKLHIMNNVIYRNYRDNVDEITEGSYWYDTCEKLYDKIFNKDGTEKLYDSDCKYVYEKNSSLQYLYVKLNNDNVIVFALTHELDLERLDWIAYKTVFFLSRNKKFVSTNWNFDKTFELIKENYSIWDFRLQEFDKYLKSYEYGTEEYLENPFKLSELEYYFSWSSDLKKFFEPLYINQDLNLKIYLNFTRSNNYPLFLYTLNGKLIPYEEIKKLENGEEILNKTRIAEAIREFRRNNKNGTSPYDGKVYKKGELSLPQLVRKIDNEIGFITVHNDYYYVIDEYYIRANEVEKQELRDALNLMNKLSSLGSV